MNNFLLKDIAVSQTGPFGSQLHESDYVDFGTPIVTVEHLGETGFSHQNLPLVSDIDKARLSKYLLKEGDIVFSRVGSVDRNTYVSISEDGWLFSGRCIRVRVDKTKAHPRFISFYFRQRNFKEMMLNISVGATMPSLNTSLMDNIPLRLPDLETQQKIASVLSALDDKIELNNRINTELEAMAKLVYEYWFVQFDFPISPEQAEKMGDPSLVGKPYKSSGGKMVWNEELKREIPEGWESGNIMEITDFFGGGTPKTTVPEYWNGEFNFYTPADYEESLFSLSTKEKITEKGLKNCSSKLFKKGTIFITARGSVGKINVASEPMAMNQSCYGLFGKRDLCYPFIFQHVTELVNYIKAKASGSIFNALVTNDFKFTKLPIPPDSLIEAYNDQTLNLFEKILANKKQNQELSKLRDWLLPMLMNGQVHLDGLGDSVEEEELGMVAEREREKYNSKQSEIN
jgi:type I restriction enzyme S subunit